MKKENPGEIMPAETDEQDGDFVSPKFKSEDIDREKNLRPRYFSEFIGQSNIIDNLKIFIIAAKSMKEPLDKVIL